MNEVQSKDVRQRILETAADLFMVQGFDGVSIRQIAESCNLSKAGLYYYFKDKEDLFLAVLDENLGVFEELLTNLQTLTGSSRSIISSFIKAVFAELPLNVRSIFQKAQQDLSKVNPAARTSFNKRYEEKFLAPLAEIIQTGIVSNQIRDLNPHIAVWALLGLMYPFFNREFHEDASKEEVVRLIESIFFEGIAVKL
jgi:AcrR family transcriptional regulator